MDDPDFTVDSLCSLQNMSRSSFYNKLKALTGQALKRLYPADTLKPCGGIVERGWKVRIRSGRNDWLL